MSKLWTLGKAMFPLIIPRLWRDLWHWNTIEERLLVYVKETATEGDAASVLAAVDKFTKEKEWMMNIEYEKRMKINEVLKETTPKECLELGTYFGYSGLSTACQLTDGGRLITVEKSDKNANIAERFFKFAGVNQVTIVAGDSSDVIPSLHSTYSVEKLDYVFIDHWKSRYLPDLKLLEENQLLRKGTVVIADNTLFPGSPEYLKYIEGSSKYTTERFYCDMKPFNLQDAMTISVYNGDE